VHYLALDVGGTSTRAVVVEADGRCVGYGTSGGGNPTASGGEEAAAAIAAAARVATAAAGAHADGIPAAVVAIAGESGLAGEPLRRALAATRLACDVVFENDVLATYHSGSLAAGGYAIVAGTGAVAIRLEGSRVVATVDGLGWLLGDAGSGFWIGRRVVRAVAAALDGRRPPTALAPPLLAELGIGADGPRADGRPAVLQALVDATYQLRPVELARFARLAFDAEAAGDEAASEIVAAAARALAVTGAAIASPDVATGPIVLGGSILARQPALADSVVTAMRAAGVAGPATTVPDGLAGAAVLALRRGGVAVDEAVFGRIRSSLATLR
jgi:N-acetylglucosamine kinase-like BadF-type ATPase